MNHSINKIEVTFPYKGLKFVAIIAFALVSFVMAYLSQVDLSLAAIQDGIYGEATFQNVDVSIRKNLIWKLLFYGLIISSFLYFILKSLSNFAFANELTDLLAILSVAGLLTWWSELVGIPLVNVKEFVHFSFCLAPLYIFAKRLVEKKGETSKITFFQFLLAIISFGILSFMLVPEGLSHMIRFAMIAVVFLALKILLSSSKWNTSIFGLFILTPFCYFIYLEFLVNAQTEGSQFGTFFWLAIFLMISAYFIWLDHQGKDSRAKLVLGSMVTISMTILAYYNYAIDYPVDKFEIANQANAMMRFFHFHEWPFIEYLSSHNLYDHIASFAYTAINGYQENVSYISYDFLRHALGTFAGFILLRFLFGHWAIAALFVCLFPFNRALFPMSFAILMVVPWVKTFKSFQAKNIMMILALMVLMLLWRMDVGLGNLVASLGLFLVYIVQFGGFTGIKKMIKPVLLGTVLTALGFILTGALFGFDTLQDHLSQALGYFSADQAHGWSKVTNDTNHRLLYIHYLTFPLMIFAIGLYVTIRFKVLYEQKPRILISLLYFIFYYFANFQRGLVRHSFVIGTDSFLSSFAFLIFGLTVALLVKKEWQLICFLITSIFFIHNFRLAKSKGLHSVYEKALNNLSINHPEKITGTKYFEGRMTDKHKPYSNIKNFMDANFNENQTLLDFTNAPMLYFYTQRQVPSYFNQYLQNTVTSKLQLQNLKNIESVDIPVVVFQNHPLEWGDATDFVPNTLRYIETTQYIYAHYSPYKIIDGKEIWLKKSNPLTGQANKELQNDSLQIYDLQLMPSIKNLTGTKSNETTLNQIDSKVYSFPPNQRIQNAYLSLSLDDVKEEQVFVDFEFPDSSIVRVKFNSSIELGEEYGFPIAWIYKLNKNQLSSVIVKLNLKSKVKNFSIQQTIPQ